MEFNEKYFSLSEANQQLVDGYIALKYTEQQVEKKQSTMTKTFDYEAYKKKIIALNITWTEEEVAGIEDARKNENWGFQIEEW